ncbi:MAG: RagB/SusD family nutrient uptake outer membrane protein [Gemmatimonadales bacterium]
MTKLPSLAVVLGTVLLASCRDPNIPDLNNPGLDDLESNPTRLKVVTAAQGLLVGARLNIAEFNGYVSELGVFGRESYIFDPGDNRFESELLVGPLDPGGPRFGGNLWISRYTSIRATNIILNALDNAALTDMPTAEKEATRGFAQTLQALDFLLVINTRDSLGAPIDVNRPLGATLAPFATRTQVFDHIINLLDSADTHLGAGGAVFPFQLSRGFSDFGTFNTPTAFRQFNRALKTRVQVYRGAIEACAACFTNARTMLTTAGQTFIDTILTADTAGLFNRGVYHSFSTGSGDLQNGLFDPTPAKLYVHPDLLASAETQAVGGQPDRRYLAKVVAVANRVYGQHSSNLAFRRYASNVASLPIIRNEELILLRAEANVGLSNLVEAARDINFIRVNSGGLLAIASLGVQTQDSVRRVLVKQKRYSLLFEGGHSWLDARHYRRAVANLGLPNQTGDQVFRVMPVPLDECLPRPPAPDPLACP